MKLHDVVLLTVNIPDKKLFTDMHGTIVWVHPGHTGCFELEIVNRDGETLVETVRPSWVRVLPDGHIPQPNQG